MHSSLLIALPARLRPTLPLPWPSTRRASLSSRDGVAAVGRGVITGIRPCARYQCEIPEYCANPRPHARGVSPFTHRCYASISTLDHYESRSIGTKGEGHPLEHSTTGRTSCLRCCSPHRCSGRDDGPVDGRGLLIERSVVRGTVWWAVQSGSGEGQGEPSPALEAVHLVVALAVVAVAAFVQSTWL